MAYSIKIDNFEGPFDLLLHLIKKNKMDIYNIKVLEITNQYLEYVENLKEFDLESASEFILIAATLLEIKSKMLLPSYKEDEEESEILSKEDLINKLVQYKRFKKAAGFLKDRQEGFNYYTKKAEIIIGEPKEDINFTANITMLDLYTIYNNLLNRYNEKNNLNNTLVKEIPIDMYKIEDKMVNIRNIIKRGKQIDFSNLLSSCEYKIEAVVTFLALLELVKLKEVNVFQEDNFSKIFVEGIDKNDI